MTSRPSLAVSQRQPQRQPQRSLSGSGLSQRPAHQQHQRTLSQQYLPPSPIRNDLTPDAGDVTQGRYGTTPKRGGSRLKLELELTNDGNDHAGFSESPHNLDPLSANKAFTPSRMMPMTDASEMGDISPQPSRSQTADNDPVPLPMPPRRPRFVVPISRPRLSSTPAAPIKKDTRPKPFVLEVPSSAPRYSSMGKSDPPTYADFYPWHGNHAEDVFSDSIIRNGYFDKTPAQMQAELSSARAPLYPSLKQKTGLHMLSTIFTGILHQRRHSGQITSASSFKPPPRATLTDTKREAWLKELANPTTSLRRLSRTIPHGIRGKVLLEQCLNKNIPSDRAVWLAKCVGANELRAFKRKALANQTTLVMGGETKWIRDWTICVENFVDAVVGSFGEKEWKAKVTYAIRLATHLYAEYLLDRDHYMDWLVSGLKNSNQARLPMWILIIRIYWKDLLRFRKTGRRLVSALLSHHAAICQHPDKDILLPLSTQFSSLLETLLLASPESFVHPPTWSRYRDTYLSSLPIEEGPLHLAYKLVDARNERLTRTHIKSQPAVRGVLVKMLDDTLRKPSSDDLATEIWRISEDKPSLVKTLLEWCMSLYRPGMAKVYVTTSILRCWSALDIDVTGAILERLDTDPLQETERKRLVYHLVSELVRTDHFSFPRYLQWLIARGGLVDHVETEPDGPCLTRLLVEIPTHSLSDSMRSLRATMLRRAGFSVEEQANDTTNALNCIKLALGVSVEGDDEMSQRKPMSIKKLAKRIKLSSRALQTEVGYWLYNEFMAGLPPSLKSEKCIELSASRFDVIRTLLEAAQDYSMLDNVLKALLGCRSADLLASCVDTVNLHLQTFAAMGSAKSLFQSFLERLKAISEEQGIGARPLLASLASLAPRIPGLEDISSQLQSELIRTDRSNAVDASSPLSDNMATQLQDDETELNEQIEKLASYTSADRPTMERLFQAIINRLQACWGKADERQRPYCVLLTRLRVFDTQHFDTLMRGWVQHIRKLTNRPPIAQIFPLLVSSACLPLTILFATASRSAMQTAQNQPSAVGYASIYMQEILQMLMMQLSPTHVMTSEDCYRFRIIQEQARLEHAKALMLLIRGTLAEYSASRNQQAPITQPLDDEKMRMQFLELLRSLVLVDSQAASQTLSLKSPDPKLASLIETITTKLLVPSGGGGQKTFEQVLELANEFTLPFCQIKLSLNLAIDDSAGPEAAERLQMQLGQLSKAMDNAINANNVMWTGILSCLSPDITHHMKNRAEARFLDLIPTLKSHSTLAGGLEDINMSENLLAVIDAIIRGAPSPKYNQVTSTIVDKLADLWEVLASTNPDVADLKAAAINHWLPLLLSCLSLHASFSACAADTSKLANETRAKALLMLAGLMQELDNFPSANLSERVLDLALVLVDNLADDVRLRCVGTVKDTTSDPRIRYLFSFAPNPADNLMLSHREKPPPGLGINERKALVMGLGNMLPERLTPFQMRRWEILNEPTPNVGENDTSLSLHLFEARKIQ